MGRPFIPFDVLPSTLTDIGKRLDGAEDFSCPLFGEINANLLAVTGTNWSHNKVTNRYWGDIRYRLRHDTAMACRVIALVAHQASAAL